jgi:hypothetical protein
MTPLPGIRRRRTEETPADPFPLPEEPSAQETQQLTAEAAASIPPPSVGPPTTVDHTRVAQAAAAVEATAGGEQSTAIVPAAAETAEPTQPVEPAAEAEAEAPISEDDGKDGGLRRFGRWATGRSVAASGEEAVAEQATEPAAAEPEVAGAPAARPHGPSARDRGRLRRRIRYLRRARELGLRDLGGLMFDQYRFRAPNQELLATKLAALHALDSERRALEHILGERREFEDLREPGIAACPKCGALHASDARYCEVCGTPQA